MQRRSRHFFIILALALTATTPALAWADATDSATVGVGAGVMYTSAPGGEVSAASVQFELRVKFLTYLGVDLMLSPGSGEFEGGMPMPTVRASVLLYMMNSPEFTWFFAGGLAASDFGDVVSVEGGSTYVRLGSGFEFIFDGHHAIALDGFWLVPALGRINDNLNRGLQETGRLPDASEAVPLNGWEGMLGYRYFF